jgi:hypothetical protein
MTLVQRLAQLFGIAFIVLAVVGFFASGGTMLADPAYAPHVFGLFPVNLLHNLVHLAFGIWGVFACRSWAAARAYCLISGVIYGVLAVLGLIVPATFGIMPIGGNDIWLHAVIAAVLVVGGLTARSDLPAPTDMNV